MVTLVVVVTVAALWRPVRLGAVLLAGAAIPMAAQAISALVQVSEPVSAGNFGISPAQAAQAGLTFSTGLTAVFWIYCAFVVALLMVGGWMACPQRRRPAAPPAGTAGGRRTAVRAAAPVGHRASRRAGRQRWPVARAARRASQVQPQIPHPPYRRSLTT